MKKTKFSFIFILNFVFKNFCFLISRIKGPAPKPNGAPKGEFLCISFPTPVLMEFICFFSHFFKAASFFQTHRSYVGQFFFKKGSASPTFQASINFQKKQNPFFGKKKRVAFSFFFKWAGVILFFDSYIFLFFLFYLFKFIHF